MFSNSAGLATWQKKSLYSGALVPIRERDPENKGLNMKRYRVPDTEIIIAKLNGLSSFTIAQKYGISDRTIETRCSKMIYKWGAKNLINVIGKLFSNGEIVPSDLTGEAKQILDINPTTEFIIHYKILALESVINLIKYCRKAGIPVCIMFCGKEIRNDNAVDVAIELRRELEQLNKSISL
jgi:hypothetical protein